MEMLAPMLSMLILAVPVQCPSPSASLLSKASILASRFDRGGAAALLRNVTDCGDVAVNAVYLQGLLDARAAASVGGTAESLAPVKEAMAVLAKLGANQSGLAETARLVLHAAAAAAQTERDEMRLYLESATRLEVLQTAGGQTAPLIVPAMEMAGSLWLQVDRYEEARRAYQEAVQQHGPSLGTTFGLARSASRLGDVASACNGYRALLAGWAVGGAEPPEIHEARAYLERPECHAPPTPR